MSERPELHHRPFIREGFFCCTINPLRGPAEDYCRAGQCRYQVVCVGAKSCATHHPTPPLRSPPVPLWCRRAGLTGRAPPQDLDWRKYLSIYCIGVRRYILKEDDNMEKSRRHLRR